MHCKPGHEQQLVQFIQYLATGFPFVWALLVHTGVFYHNIFLDVILDWLTYFVPVK
jgi:hypothetical protein